VRCGEGRRARRRNVGVVDEDARGEPLTDEVEHKGLLSSSRVRPPSSPPAGRHRTPRSMRHRRPEVQGIKEAMRIELRTATDLRCRGSKRPCEIELHAATPDSALRRREPTELRRWHLLSLLSLLSGESLMQQDGWSCYASGARGRLEVGQGAGDHVSLPHLPAAAPPPPSTSSGVQKGAIVGAASPSPRPVHPPCTWLAGASTEQQHLLHARTGSRAHYA
jgi:hypothetical protein